MDKVISSTEVRKNWSEVIDSVVREKPVFIKRRRDTLAFLSLDQLDLLLETFKLNLDIFKEEDGTFTGSVEEIDLVGNASSVEELIELMSYDLIEYADEYMDNFDMYYRAPNRRVHFPFVYKVIAHEGDLELIEKMYNIRIEAN